MLKESFHLVEEGTLPLFYMNWPHWAIVLNMHLSIPKTSEFPKAENVSTLSEILQEEVPEKYFLSEEQTRKLLDKLLEAHKEVECMTQTDYPQLSLQEVED